MKSNTLQGKGTCSESSEKVKQEGKKLKLLTILRIQREREHEQ
jgi:hypothetical protein